MRRLWGIVLAGAVLAAACTGSGADATTTPSRSIDTTSPTTVTTTSSGTTTTTTTAAPPGSGIVLPSVFDIDTGALEVAAQPTTQEAYVEFISDLPRRQIADGGVVFDVEECRLSAPGQWVFRGIIDAPEEAIGAELGLYVSFTEGDVVLVTPVRIRIRSTGEFAIPIDFVAINRIEGAQPHTPNRDLADACFTRVDRASTPVATTSDAAPTVRTDAVVYTAPEGSMQSFGIGADLTTAHDPRRSWAYATYADTEIPFEEIWLPSGEIPRLVNARVETPLCRTVTTATSRVSIIETRDCHEELRGTPTTLDGWLLSSAARRDIYRQTDGGFVRLVGKEGTTIDDLLQIASSLTLVHNAAYRVPATASHDLDEAIVAALAPEGWTPHGRRYVEGRWLVGATKQDQRESSDRVAWYRVTVIEMIETSDGLWTAAEVPRTGGTGTSSCVLTNRQRTSDRRTVIVIVGAGADWTIQSHTSGGWQDLVTDGGTHLDIGDDDLQLPEFRAVDGTGAVVRCSTDGSNGEPGKAWSDYRSPDAGGLTVEMAPGDAEVAAGSTTRIEGSNAYRRRNLEIGVCAASSMQWIDRADCGRTFRTRAKFDGTFAAIVEIPATITTRTGATIDCRIEQCVIRVDTIEGIHRSGWVPITVREDT